jgi:phenylalanyl-tRNA synthetase beta chain
MRFSWDWILRHVEPVEGPEECANLLSMHGLTVDEVSGEKGDYILDIDITSNRPDAMNVRGIARELAAITGAPLLPVDTSIDETDEPAADYCSVRIDDVVGCHRFCARVIKGVANGPSPEWMARRLEAVGLRSINLLVDVTNYVLWELGHPLHGYDLALVPEGGIVVRRAKDGEELKMIDGTVRKLDSAVLVIADERRAIGIGGIMGGADTEINDTTVDILLEGAYFAPALIRRGSKKLELATEASYRFERGADINGMVEAIDRCCRLYQELAGGRVCKGLVDAYPTAHRALSVTMSHKRFCSFAGLDIPKERVKGIFEALELRARMVGDRWAVDIPTRRVDLEREADLFEEVIRIVGYEGIPPTIPHVDLAPAPPLKMHQVVDAAEGAATGAGYTEVWNYDFVDPADNKFFGHPQGGEEIPVLNPIASPQMSAMRLSLAPSLLRNIQHNHNRGNFDLRLFETARVFCMGPSGPEERMVIGFAADATDPAPFWRPVKEKADLFELKGVMEFLFTRLGLRDIIIAEGTADFLEAVERADVEYRGRVIGWFGRLREEIAAHFDLSPAPYLGQLDLGSLAEEALPERRLRRWSKFPSVSRDISFAPAKDLSFGRIRSAIQSSGVDEVVDIRLIDLYRGEATSGKTGMTVRIVYQSEERTLTQEEVDSFHGKIRESLQKLGVNFR